MMTVDGLFLLFGILTMASVSIHSSHNFYFYSTVLKKKKSVDKSSRFHAVLIKW